MKRWDGFTVIEVIIVMAIIAILLAIGTVSFRGFQASTRDKGREADVVAIQNHLESLYPRELRDDGGNIIKTAGSYPAYSTPGSGGGRMTNATFMTMFDELPDNVKQGPQPGEELVSAGVVRYGSSNKPDPANLTQLNDYKANYAAHALQGKPSGSYIYYAFNRHGNRCITVSDECSGYVILYHTEGQPGVWQAVESKRK